MLSGEFSYNTFASVYERYTTMVGRVAEADETAAFLERFCKGRSALELGIGNGRVAVPLTERGVTVEGIDASDNMLKLLATRTNLIKAWKGNIADFNSEQRYRVVFCVYNTFMVLATREEQIACLRSAAEALDEEGVMVIEVRVPDFDGFVGGQKTTTMFVDHENTFVNAEIHDPITQNLTQTLLWFNGASVRRIPERLRYVYHQELDTMAECVGLELSERWGDWKRGAFTDASKRHVSVYRRTRLKC
ncbi:MAG: class I SAM-dependent methyltransferase [Mesorhizobium sp.]|uniref:class I SAM-dependent DNA methyltransferase n=1 Tax=Mesorhizobium sp. TaxID=1871066 RepID=UPI00121AE632|nr:methyltransferase domain-containing protein [Mesorhizobium sp.]TIP38972.1 MAG: class I SAM-dependent methyltransferase [Mesorhizobium sp.]TIW49106.1 MAG: class I SAM-dependent methyltransferase [Mesorhizobium sp.]